HDVGDLLVALATQYRGDERERGVALARRQVAEAPAVALKNSCREVGPASPLAAGEAEHAFRALGVGERREECVGGRYNSRRYRMTCGRGGRWGRTGSLHGAGSNRDREREPRQSDAECFHPVTLASSRTSILEKLSGPGPVHESTAMIRNGDSSLN